MINLTPYHTAKLNTTTASHSAVFWLARQSSRPFPTYHGCEYGCPLEKRKNSAKAHKNDFYLSSLLSGWLPVCTKAGLRIYFTGVTNSTIEVYQKRNSTIDFQTSVSLWPLPSKIRYMIRHSFVRPTMGKFPLICPII